MSPVFANALGPQTVVQQVVVLGVALFVIAGILLLGLKVARKFLSKPPSHESEESS